MEGYIYCFSNPSMPGILKIGMTERSPESRLSEANASDTWRPPTPYKIEFAKFVKNPKEKESILHILFEQYTERINPRREFFRITTEEVKRFFDLIDGEMWCQIADDDEKNDDSDNASESDRTKSTVVAGCRDMAQCFFDGQRIRHKIGVDKIWIGHYNAANNCIVYDGKTFTLNKFTKLHYETDRPDRTPSANAWRECECEKDGKWISTYNLPVLDQNQNT